MTFRGAALVPILLALGGCGLFEPSTPPLAREDDTPEHRACRAEAKASPAMRALERQRNPANEYNTERLEREERGVFTRAYRDCLRARGLALPGGVEAVTPR
jgi:hypothetical protein